MYQLNPLLTEGSAYKDYLVKHPEVIKKELDPIKRKMMIAIRRKAIIGRKVSKAMAKGPDYYVSYLPGGTKVKYDIVPGESTISKLRRLPRPWARSDEWKDSSIVTKAIGRAHEGTYGKYRKPVIMYPDYVKQLRKSDALESGNLDRIISTREPGDFINTWRKKHPSPSFY